MMPDGKQTERETMSDKLRTLVAVVLGSTDLAEAMSALIMARSIQPAGKLPPPPYNSEHGMVGFDSEYLIRPSTGPEIERRAKRKADEPEIERRLANDPAFRKLVLDGNFDDQRMMTDAEYRGWVISVGSSVLDTERRKAQEAAESIRPSPDAYPARRQYSFPSFGRR